MILSDFSKLLQQNNSKTLREETLKRIIYLSHPTCSSQVYQKIIFQIVESFLR